MESSKNVPVLNSLRAVAALSVCLYHFVCTVVGFIHDENVLKVFSYGHYGVQMFFVISGFIIPWSMYHGRYRIENFFTFTAKRLIRLEPPYLISLFLAIAHTYLRTLSPYYNGLDIVPTVKQTVLHFGYLIPFFEDQTWIRPVYWTLAIEFQYYIAIGLLFSFISNNNRWIRICMYVLFLSGPILIKANFLPYHLPVFLLGILLYLYKAKYIDLIELYIVVFFTIICIGYYNDIPTLFFSGLTFFIIMYFNEFKSKIGDFLGNISYSIYLFHSLSGMIILNYFSHIVTSPLIKFILIVISVLTTIGVAYIIYLLIEKPSKRWSSRIKYNNKVIK